MSETATAAPLAVGDQVELLHDFPQKKPLRQGARGVVVVAGADMAWNMVSVVFGPDPDRGRPWLLHPRHLRKVE